MSDLSVPEVAETGEAREIAPAPAAEEGNSSMLAMIERVAMSPDVPIDRLERLLDMQERLEGRQREEAFRRAFATMQADLPEIGKREVIRDKQGRVRSTYADWADVNSQIRPVLGRYGFGLSFEQEVISTEQPNQRFARVTAILTHAEGHERRSMPLDVPIDADAFMNAAQKVASAVSYGKRYTAGSLLNLTFRDVKEDDDGTGTSAPATIDADTYRELRDKLAEAERDEAKFLKYYNAPSLEQFPQSKVGDALAQLNRAIRRNQEGAA